MGVDREREGGGTFIVRELSHRFERERNFNLLARVGDVVRPEYLPNLEYDGLPVYG